MKPRILAAAALAITALTASVAIANDITVITQQVLFDFVGQTVQAQLRVNLYTNEAPGTYRLCVKPNGANACPVWATGSEPQCTLVTFPGAPETRKAFVSLTSKPGDPGGPPGKPVRNCALTYSLVPDNQPNNYFGRPEIGIAYRRR